MALAPGRARAHAFFPRVLFFAFERAFFAVTFPGFLTFLLSRPVSLRPQLFLVRFAALADFFRAATGFLVARLERAAMRISSCVGTR